MIGVGIYSTWTLHVILPLQLMFYGVDAAAAVA